MRIKNFDELAITPFHRTILEALQVGLAAADPQKVVEKVLQRRDSRLSITGDEIELRRLHVVGFGKASVGMVKGVINVVGDAVQGGVAISPFYEGRIGPVEIVKGDHPVPGENTLKSSRRLLQYLEEAVEPDDVVLVLISGGGSALFELPEDDIELSEIAQISKDLMRAGADIVELNTVRKHLSAVKGGKLLRKIRAKKVYSLIISDVVGDRLDTIASGPTAPDATTFKQAVEVLRKYGLWKKIPARIREWLERGVKGEVPETVKPGDEVLKKVRNIIVASNAISLEAMAQYLEAKGYRAVILTPYLEGEAREVGKVLAAIAKSIADRGYLASRPAALLAGGETTVTVKGNGVGGRNQELCLSIALGIHGYRNIVFGCMGSDGVDGVSPAAGALVDGSTVEKALEKGLDPLKYLENNDSYTFFSKVGLAIMTGYTGTNVNDFVVGLIF
ncbi:MAG: glycerate kinase [Thermoprotei archaeon]|nr:MAG: glycerate kinase [Thermoprotei archaeon]